MPASGKTGIDVARLPGRVRRREMRGDLGVQQAFEGAIAALAQVRLGLHRQPMGVRQRLRRLARALQVAGDDRVDPLVGERRRQRRGLALAFLVQRDVEMALQAALGVPGGFAVADQEDVPMRRSRRWRQIRVQRIDAEDLRLVEDVAGDRRLHLGAGEVAGQRQARDVERVQREHIGVHVASFHGGHGPS